GRALFRVRNMESRPDLVPPCCAACAVARVAEVTWSEEAGWQARHGDTSYQAASGVEALVALQHMHYAPPVTVHLLNNPQAPITAASFIGEARHG
ncbi:MAG: hypothetical protein NUW01_13195, partial [Gemmatimonadaceae bacterium]|nr:hypothetical protein [Gemmatimonadaceae bacterium]